ncbi:glycosyl hydrolase 115 family protein [Termitidicoccus mucosus]|uniref:Glycosyl hydrolase n=2 Tax=Termitidicoccus mucosus TaxID=1184151 RepID=A0A178ILX0_9BACT|nr:glycosyl hydrolase [Opitutaceae bacterium TSB47]
MPSHPNSCFKKTTLFAIAGVLIAIVPAAAAPSLGLDTAIVAETAEAGSFALVTQKQGASLVLDKGDWPGVLRAAGDLQADIRRVTGVKPALEIGRAPSGKSVVIAGTLGKSTLIDSLAKTGKIDTAPIAGKWESFIITTVANPLPHVAQALVIVGSDKRGAIYGIYEISEQIGVSPWYWWADAPVKQRNQLFIKTGTYVQGPPAVKYRGIFINDEEPAFGPWAREKFGGINSKMYAHMFELILRLRGNYLWPAMWGKAFNEDDPLNPKVADEYGIVMGTSHHEPMMRAQKEWGKHKKEYGNGEWNYATNEAGLNAFWQDGMSRNKHYEQIVTIGMRGDGDEPMVEGGDIAANMALMEHIVADQRKILAKTVNPDVTKVPQVWALYKEVADYYQDGMRVPDDVTLLWCDDNWGNNRRLPTAGERKRSGGAGIYYHFDYVGGPRSYKWINTNPLPKIWEQMSMAYEYGADRIWIVNVGDLKPMELPTEFFLRLAWNPRALPKEKIADFTRRWAEREFGPQHAADIADIVSRYAKYNGWRKPELLEPKTFSIVNYQEAERVLAGWSEIVAKAEEIDGKLPREARDAFFQLVLYPAKASATVAELHIATGLNQLYAKQKRGSANLMARHVRGLFEEDKNLSNLYHAINGGKWKHMMAQTRIGYTSWNDPKTNIMPALAEIAIPDEASMGVSVEGSESAWPGESKPAKLPVSDSINQQRHAIEIYKRGSKDFSYEATADKPWVKLSATSGNVKSDQRIWVGVDWDKVPVGNSNAIVTITRPEGESVPIQVSAVRSDKYTRKNTKAFGGLTGPTAIIAANATKNIEAGGARWDVIPDYGRGPSGMTIFPMTAASVQPPADSPRLEYQVLIPQAGDIRVDLITGPTLNVQPGRGVRVAVSFDDQPPHIIDAFAGQGDGRGGSHSPAIKDWGTWVKDNARTMKSTHTISEPGVHTLKIWMVDPGVVLEKLIIHTGDVRPSYFGPPATNQN